MPDRKSALHARLASLRPWALPIIAFTLALIAGLVLWAKLHGEVWAYYSDSGWRAAIDDASVRPVLWQDPEPQGFSGDDGAATGTLEAAFSADGTLMILSRPGGEGANAELYQSLWDGRLWSKPEPLTAVNTEANERSPALSRDGRYLYFASDRKGGLGGYDLFVARWDGSAWSDAKALPPGVNTPANELGPALSADDSELYFSSDRNAGTAEDIYVSRITLPEPEATPEKPGNEDRGKRRKGRNNTPQPDSVQSPPLPPIPEFTTATAVASLNSKAADVRAVPTLGGDHVVLASDRDRGKRSGFKLYLSRVVRGKPLPPEEIDLAIRQGDITAPAVRMDGYDLLFSAGDKPKGGTTAAQRLFRTTTREVEGYTDLTRWQQFKTLLHHIAWWILLALAALIALIYIAEKWRDMTSLFHKCLAGSAFLHLVALLLAMILLIATTIEKDEARHDQEVQVSIDALAQEELALESVPEETALTDTSTQLETEKVESEFGATGFEANDEAQPVPAAAPSAKEAVVVEAQPATSEATAQPLPQPTADTSLLKELTASTLPEISQPEMEEREPGEAQAAADTRPEQFEPSQVTAETAKLEPQMTDDAAVATPTDTAQVTDQQPAESLAEQEQKPEFVESTTSESTPRQPQPAADAPPLESELLSTLADTTFVDPNQAALEEPNAAAAEGAADPSQELFDPGQAAAGLATEQATAGETAADTAATSPSAATDIAAGTLDTGAAAVGAPAAEPAQAGDAPTLPAAGQGPDLPESALVDAGAPQLEEPAAQAAGSPPQAADGPFQPTGAAANLATSQAAGEIAADTAVANAGDVTEVPVGDIVPAATATATQPAESAASMPVGKGPPAPPAALPEVTLVDAGAPQLEERAGQPAGPPADPTRDLFNPGQVASRIATAQAEGLAVADSADKRSLEGAAIAGAERTAPGTAEAPHRELLASGSLPDLGGGALPANLTPPGLAPAISLPGELEAPPGLDPRGMTDLVRKQRGKPGIDTIKQMGGTEGSEGAIGAAIKWLTENQEPDGRWDTVKHGATQNHDPGGTGLALLCFYGWGERHDAAGKYQQQVRRALDWLLAQQGEDGYLGARPGMMYSHAIATIALCEAYGITHDPKLRQPAERAIAYTLAAQHPTLGGWRYSPGNGADVSSTGWQYMALHSARMAGLAVPEEAFTKTRAFLDRMGGGKYGGRYGYLTKSDSSRAMVATGMFCRQLDLVPPGDPMMQESARYLKMHPMKASKPDLYYVYYTTLALYQHQGPIWLEWNERMQNTLPLLQGQVGATAGSWDPSSSMTSEGGRVISTALATLSLEVYYRLLPMYGFRNTEVEAPAPKRRDN